MRGALGLAAVAALALALPSCARRVAPPIPEGEDYARPTPEGARLTPKEVRALDEAWRRVLAGETDGAVRSYQRILKDRPGFVPAETGLAYARLRGGQLTTAAAGFASVLERRPDYRPALVGAGSTAFRLGAGDDALRLFRRALEADPSDAHVRKRVAALKLQVAERHMAAAGAAREAGDVDAAAAEYAAALDAAPELSTVRLDLAEVLAERGDVDRAIAVLEADPSAERPVSLRLGALLLAQERYEEAREVYRDLLGLDPSDTEARRGERAAQDALDFLAQPEEYRRIGSASRVSRADFAALVAVKVTGLARLPARAARVAVDISASWAREHIATVLGLGIMDVYPNHTFQPGASMRRGDVARAVSRTLDLLRVPRAPASVPVDMGPSHLDREAALHVLGMGIMPLAANGAFEPWRPVSGREAVEIVEAIARIAGP